MGIHTLAAQAGQVLGNATKLIISHQHPIGKGGSTGSTELTSEPIINYILFLFDANVDYLPRPGVGSSTDDISVAVEGHSEPLSSGRA